MPELVHQNYTTGTRATFLIPEKNNLSFTATRWAIPGVATSAPRQPTPFTDMPHRGDKLVYTPLTIEFIVTEDLSNWLEIYNWLVGFTAPQHPSQWINRTETYLDGSMMLYSSHNNKLLEVAFKNLTPVDLSEIPFQTEDNETQIIKATVTFEYESFEIKVEGRLE